MCLMRRVTAQKKEGVDMGKIKLYECVGIEYCSVRDTDSCEAGIWRIHEDEDGNCHSLKGIEHNHEDGPDVVVSNLQDFIESERDKVAGLEKQVRGLLADVSIFADAYFGLEDEIIDNYTESFAKTIKRADTAESALATAILSRLRGQS